MGDSSRPTTEPHLKIECEAIKTYILIQSESSISPGNLCFDYFYHTRIYKTDMASIAHFKGNWTSATLLSRQNCSIREAPSFTNRFFRSTNTINTHFGSRKATMTLSAQAVANGSSQRKYPPGLHSCKYVPEPNL